MRVAAGRDFGDEDVAPVNIAMNESTFETVQVIESQCRLVHYHLTTKSLPDVGVQSFSICIAYQFLYGIPTQLNGVVTDENKAINELLL